MVSKFYLFFLYYLNYILHISWGLSSTNIMGIGEVERFQKLRELQIRKINEQQNMNLKGCALTNYCHLQDPYKYKQPKPLLHYSIFKRFWFTLRLSLK